jgi:hypothetical protein
MQRDMTDKQEKSMMQILNRPMVKEVLVLVVSGVIATMICSRVYAAPLPDAEPAAPAVASTASAPAQGQYANQLQPMSKEEGRQMLLSTLHGQVPLASATLTPNR